jgi:hypothetical protein
MRRIVVVSVAVLAFAPFALDACGNSTNNGSSNSPTSTSTSTFGRLSCRPVGTLAPDQGEKALSQ